MARQPLRDFFVLLLLGVALLCLALVVRSGMWEVRTNDEPINSAMRAALAQREPELSTQDSLAVYQLYPTAFVSKSGLRYLVHNPGKGPLPAKGDDLAVYFAGRRLDGTEVESTYKSGQPFHFRLGSDTVMPAFNEAFGAMRPGEKRTLIIPPWLGYPDGHRPPGVPAHATLVYEVERL